MGGERNNLGEAFSCHLQPPCFGDRRDEAEKENNAEAMLALAEAYRVNPSTRDQMVAAACTRLD